MNSPAEFLDALRSRYGLRSDYQVSKLLGVSASYVSKYRHGRVGFSDELAAKVAELLDLDPGYVLARLYEERAQSDEGRNVWRELARRLAPATVALLLLVVGLGDWLGEPVSGALAFAASSGPLNIMSNAAWVLALALLLTRSGIAGRFSR